MLFIKKTAFQSLEEFLKNEAPKIIDLQKFPFKGVVLVPSPDSKETGVYFLNPVFGKSDKGDGDLLIQRNGDPTCPYPPGY